MEPSADFPPREDRPEREDRAGDSEERSPPGVLVSIREFGDLNRDPNLENYSFLGFRCPSWAVNSGVFGS